MSNRPEPAYMDAWATLDLQRISMEATGFRPNEEDAAQMWAEVVNTGCAPLFKYIDGLEAESARVRTKLEQLKFHLENAGGVPALILNAALYLIRDALGTDSPDKDSSVS